MERRSDSYHDTVSKMARKYSQYRLPEPSELESDEDDNELNNNELAMEDDENDEDEDLFSETNTNYTTISRKSFAFPSNTNKKPKLLRKPSSIKIMSPTRYNPIEEIREIHTDRALFIEIFDKYFDESKEGDVDFIEFKKGLLKLGHTSNDKQIAKLFNILLMNGDVGIDTYAEHNKYLQSDQFSDFLTRKFDNPHLIAFQALLLDIIIPNAKKNDNRNCLINANDAQQWDAAEVSLAECEMRQAMEQMVDSEMEKIKKNSEFQEELSRRMADPQFCKDLNAENWNCYEVAYWAQQNGYNYCMKRLFDQQIDGNVLLHDMNKNMLINTLGVTPLHSNKFMRNVNQLKAKITGDKMVLTCDYNVSDLYVSSSAHHRFENKINALNLKLLTHESEKKMLSDKTLSLQFEINDSEQRILKFKAEMVEMNKILQLNDIKLIDYDSMKSAYDAICKQLNDTKIEYQNIRHENESQVELFTKQYTEQTDALKQEISKLTAMNDSLSDENVQLKASAEAAEAEQKNGAVSDIDVFKSEEWSNAEVAYWLTTIGMKKYRKEFVEQSVDGQILLNDVDYNNLINDLRVKSIHAPKIMREINKLKSSLCSNAPQQIPETLTAITETVTLFHVEPTENRTMHKLKNELNEAQTKLNTLIHKNSDTNTMPNMPSMPNMNVISPQSSIFSLPDHVRTDSTLTVRTVYSEGDIKLNSDSKAQTQVDELQIYVKSLELKLTELETKNRELSTLFHRADKNLKEYTSAVIPFQERIRSLELQNEKRKETIDKLNKRIYRRNEAIKYLKQQKLQENMTTTYGHNVARFTPQGPVPAAVAARQYVHHSHSALRPVKKVKYAPNRHRNITVNGGGMRSAGGGIRLTHENLLSHHSQQSQQSQRQMPQYAQSATSTDDNSIIGSITSMAYGYFMGANNGN